jgi:hypothetical protein
MRSKKVKSETRKGSTLELEPAFDLKGLAHRLMDFGTSGTKACLDQIMPNRRPVGCQPTLYVDLAQDKGANVVECPQDACAPWRRSVDGYRFET